MWIIFLYLLRSNVCSQNVVSREFKLLDLHMPTYSVGENLQAVLLSIVISYVYLYLSVIELNTDIIRIS